jgi:hypothetical protein
MKQEITMTTTYRGSHLSYYKNLPGETEKKHEKPLPSIASLPTKN